jgi:hypothetical protein
MGDQVRVGPFGDFNNKNVFGFFDHKIEDSFPTKTMFGMRIDALCPNATLRDETGALWNVVRYHDHAKTLGMLLRTNADGVRFYEQHPDAGRAYAGPVVNRLVNGTHITEVPGGADARPTPGGGRQAFRYERTVDDMVWSEGDLMQLTGVKAAPAIGWYSPNEEGGWMFTSYLTRVKGTIMGRKCEGFSEYATCWSAPGVNWNQTYVDRGMIWLIVCNEYEDGTRDLCHLGYNRDDSQFAFMADENGPIKVTRDIKLKVVLDKGRYPKTLFYEIDGEQWRWDGTAHGDLGHPQIGIERGREGTCTRVGEKRKPILSYGWVNFFSDSRIDHLVIEAP